MPSPESSRANLEHGRTLGRVIFWRSWHESQRIKAEIVWLHHTKPDLSQRVIARTFHVSQSYVARLLQRVRLRGIEKALGEEAFEHYRGRMDDSRREHFQAVGGPASLTTPSSRETERVPVEPQSPAPASWAGPGLARVGHLRELRVQPPRRQPATPKSEDTRAAKYVELARSTSGEVTSYRAPNRCRL
jgi:hypothetical protein